MSLEMRFWGTRGSIPSPGPSTVRYGGNTPCVELRTSTGWLVILDAGTGIRDLGLSLTARSNGAPIAADIFLSHAHWDHIQGIPFFAPIFQPGNRFTIWASKSLETQISQVIRDQMAPVFFPVTFDELNAQIEFCELSEGKRSGNGYEVSVFEVRHPGGALAYRFEEPGQNGQGGLVYVSDNELGPGGQYKTPTGWDKQLIEYVRGARVLVHDATYTEQEYTRHGGWGHSTFEHAVTLAMNAGVEQLILFHHKPERTDKEIDDCLAKAQALVQERGGKLQVDAAKEGMTLTV